MARQEDTTGAGQASTDAGSAPLCVGRHALGLVVLLLAIVPSYLMSRVATPIGVSEALSDSRGSAEPRESDVNQISPLEIRAHIQEVALRHGVSPRLVAAIIEAESEFNPRAVSRKGARGLMQLMPATASSLDVEDAFDPFENIEGGVRHLRRLMDRFNGNLPLVLAAYNAGEQAVIAYQGVPPYRETRRYVARILRRIGAEGVTTVPSPSGRRAALSVRTAAMEVGPVRTSRFGPMAGPPSSVWTGALDQRPIEMSGPEVGDDSAARVMSLDRRATKPTARVDSQSP